MPLQYDFKVKFIFLLMLLGCAIAFADGPYQATGIKIGEVTNNAAIVWTRLTLRAERIGKESPLPKILYLDSKTGKLSERKKKSRPNKPPVVKYPDGSTIGTIEGAVPGMAGQVRVHYKKSTNGDWQTTAWQDVDPQKDFTHQFHLSGLSSHTKYQVRVEARAKAGEETSIAVEGGFQTAPEPDQKERVVFTVSTGQSYGDQDASGGGYKIYAQMLKLAPSFFIHTGDIVYYDKLAKTKALARWHWARMFSLPTNAAFHRQVSSYFIKDDHDTWMNDCWPTMKTRFMGEFTFEQGVKIFTEEVPMGKQTWRTYRWGKDLQIWLMEGRDYRSDNTIPDGPDKTIWGKAQMVWFKNTVQASDATFRLLISPTPVVGPDRSSKNDNHANIGFAHEGNALRQFIASQKNMVVICGDRHWQYVSKDAKTGVREYSCGPASNQHAGGWSNDQRYPEHQYLNVTGGFLAGFVERDHGRPTLTFRHYSVNGMVLNEDIWKAE